MNYKPSLKLLKNSFLLLLFLIFECHAIMLSGMGADTCGKVTLSYSKSNNPIGGIQMDGKTYLDETNGFTQWIAGYVSSYNWYVAKENGQIPLDPVAMGYWLKNYCEKNPTKGVFQAINTYIIEHRKK